MQKRVLPSKSDLRAAPVECTPRLCVCVCDREEKISLSGFETSHVVNTAWSSTINIHVSSFDVPRDFLISLYDSSLLISIMAKLLRHSQRGEIFPEYDDLESRSNL